MEEEAAITIWWMNCVGAFQCNGRISPHTVRTRCQLFGLFNQKVENHPKIETRANGYKWFSMSVQWTAISRLWQLKVMMSTFVITEKASKFSLLTKILLYMKISGNTQLIYFSGTQTQPECAIMHHTNLCW